MMCGQSAPWCHTVALISKTLWECLIPLICSLWFAYVYTRLMSNQTRVLKLFRLLMLPLVACEVLLIVNIFTGIVFTITPENRSEPGSLFFLLVIFEFASFVATGLLIRYYDRNFSKVRFLRAAAEDREAGSEMRGILSMITELDRLDQELELASDIQINSLPMNFPPFPDRKEFDLFASMTPAKEVGGDFYDFFLIDDDHLALVIADVSGKGIPAALFMMVSKGLIKNQMMALCDPAAALEKVNLQLYERNSSMMFVTVWLAVLEISTGKGLACNAGHENPGIRRSGGSFELLQYRHNLCIGVNKKARYQNREFSLEPGDCLFVYTDGVPEATSASGEMFGTERLAKTLNLHADAAPDTLIHQVHANLDAFADGAPQFDDITMLSLKYHGLQSPEKSP